MEAPPEFRGFQARTGREAARRRLRFRVNTLSENKHGGAMEVELKGRAGERGEQNNTASGSLRRLFVFQ